MLSEGVIMERARMVGDIFRREAHRFANDSPERKLLRAYASIANYVADGEYHREAIFRRMVGLLRDMGAIKGDVDTSARERAHGAVSAADAARVDTLELYQIAHERLEGGPLVDVLNMADDLMATLMDEGDFVTMLAGNLASAVDRYLEGRGGIERIVFETDFRREVPERVIFNPPATIAFWPDGSKTVARCAEGEEFSEYTGLLVCIAKRHLKVPRRAIFEDAMAKLLRKAERQVPKGASHAERA